MLIDFHANYEGGKYIKLDRPNIIYLILNHPFLSIMIFIKTIGYNRAASLVNIYFILTLLDGFYMQKYTYPQYRQII